MISYGKHSIAQDDIDAVIEVLNGDWLTQGPAVEVFENNLKKYFGAKYVSAVSNGTAALHLAGLTLEWSPKDIIITTPLTFLATANSILYNNSTPDFVDIDPNTYTIDPNLIEDKIKSYRNKGENVKAIIGVDYAGHPCAWKELREIANSYDVQLVNDNCHAIGASYLDSKKYAVKYADIVTQSYHPVKNITTGEGGAVLTNNPDFDKKLKGLRTHGISKNTSKSNAPWYYEMHDLGFNYRITDFQCALGSNQLKKLDQFVEKRRKIGNYYDNLFSEIDCIKSPVVNDIYIHSYHLYPLQINFGKKEISKIDFFHEMKKVGINLQVHYIPVHYQPYYQKNYGFEKGDFPIAEDFYSKEVSLPIYPSLNFEDQEKVVNKIKQLIK